jgi:3-oxoacid CoA-transferase
MSKAKETRQFNGKNYVLEESIFGDVALVKVHKADRLGNCTFRKAQNNFNEAMAKNAKLTIVEADEIVEVGQLEPESIHLQGIYVDVVIESTEPKRIEKLVFDKNPEEIVKGERPYTWSSTVANWSTFRDSIKLQAGTHHQKSRQRAERRHVR